MQNRGRRVGPFVHHPIHQGVAGAAEDAIRKAFADNELQHQSTCRTKTRNAKGRCTTDCRQF